MDRQPTPIGRRVFIGSVALGVVGVVFGSRAQGWLERALAPVLEKDGSGLSGLVPVGRFRIYTVTDELPSMPKSQYKLQVAGLVDAPFTIDYAGLLSMIPTSLTRDFQCVTGWRVRDVVWQGIKLRDLLDRAGVNAEAKAVRFTSFDGVYTESLTLRQAMRDDMLVAYQLEGEDISAAHGGPVRLYAAPMYGYKSIKWMDRIELVAEVEPGYWEKRGYDVDAWVGRSNGRDDDAI
ncbi:MAG: oxidoreductase [Acidimicrobiia bacterium]|nr:oxidoreductase [Acidimicrobiia bacterium]